MWKQCVKITDRLDRICRQLPVENREWISREAWDQLISGGAVCVDGRPVRKAGTQVVAGAELSVAFPAEIGLLPHGAAAECIHLDVSAGVAVYNKKSAQHSYPLLPWERGTFANEVCAHLTLEKILDPQAFMNLSKPPVLEGGLVQRLDFYTSGVLCVALRGEVKEKLRSLISDQKARKTYLVLAKDSLDEGEHEVYLRSGGEEKVVVSSAPFPGGVKVLVEIERLASGGGAAKYRVSTNLGLRHVVRASLAGLGAPLVGDALYGGGDALPFYQLHAESMELNEGIRISCKVPPPQSFLDSCRKLGL